MSILYYFQQVPPIITVIILTENQLKSSQLDKNYGRVVDIRDDDEGSFIL